MTWQEYNAQKEREKIEYGEKLVLEEREKITRSKEESALKMLRRNFDIGVICEITGLPESRIKELAATMRPAS